MPPSPSPFITEVNGDKRCPIFVSCCYNTETLKRPLMAEEYVILDTHGRVPPKDIQIYRSSRETNSGYSIRETIIKSEEKGIFASAIYKH